MEKWKINMKCILIITSEHSIKLVDIEIDDQLKFDNHVSTLCKKAGFQLNTIGKLRKYIGFP